MVVPRRSTAKASGSVPSGTTRRTFRAAVSMTAWLADGAFCRAARAADPLAATE